MNGTANEAEFKRLIAEARINLEGEKTTLEEIKQAIEAKLRKNGKKTTWWKLWSRDTND